MGMLVRTTRKRGKEKCVVADLTYVSRVKVEPHKMDDNKIRRAHLPVEEKPILFGAHDEIANYYGVSPDEPHAGTLDYLVAAAGG